MRKHLSLVIGLLLLVFSFSACGTMKQAADNSAVSESPPAPLSADQNEQKKFNSEKKTQEKNIEKENYFLFYRQNKMEERRNSRKKRKSELEQKKESLREKGKSFLENGVEVLSYQTLYYSPDFSEPTDLVYNDKEMKSVHDYQVSTDGNTLWLKINGGTYGYLWICQ